MAIYLITYAFIIFIGILVNWNKSEKGKKRFLFITFSILTCIAMLRTESVGIDTLQYVRNYRVISRLSFSNLSYVRYEYGFSLLCKILSLINKSPQFLIIVSSIFINTSVAIFIKKNSKNVVSSTLVYILLNFYFNNMNIMRQAIAMAIVLIAYEFLKEKKYFVFAILILLASFFHFTAIIAFAMIPIRILKFDKKFLAILLLLSIIFFVFGDKIFYFLCTVSPRLMEYFEVGKHVGENLFGGLILSFVYFVIFIFGIIMITKYSKDVFSNKNNEMNTLIGIIGFSFLFSILGMKVSILSRFVPYFSLFIISWLPNILSIIERPKDRIMLNTITISFLTLFWLILMIYRPEWYGAVPYDSILKL